jgi:hypothetical protein
MLQSRIQTKLSGDREMSPLVDQFFVVPGQEDIHVYSLNGQLQPVFTRWACRLTHASGDMNPLEHVLEKFNMPVSPVKVSFKFRDGRVAANHDFIFSFFHKDSSYSTDEKGEYDLGRLRQGTLFTIYELHQGEKGRSYDFGVQAGEKYEVILPTYTDGIVRVKDQHGKAISRFSFTATQGKRVRECQTDAEGICKLDSVEIGESLVLCDKARPEVVLNLIPSETDRDWVWRMQEYYPAQASIQVKGKQGDIRANHPLLIAIGESGEKEYTTGPDGSLELTGLTPGDSIRISEKHRPDNRVVGQLKEGENSFVLQTNMAAGDLPGFIKVRILNHRGEILPNTKVDINYRNTRQTHTTDAEGEIVLPKEGFFDETKVQATVYVPKLDKKGNVRERAVTKGFKFTTNKDLYELKLSRWSKWWWLLLLLLLLPLLLLIRLEKTIYVKLQHPDERSYLIGEDVRLNYHRSFLYDNGHFFTNDTVMKVERTGSGTYATFAKLEYSVYSWIFKRGNPLVLTAQTDCYLADTLRRRFHSVSDGDTLVLKLKPKYQPLDFVVRDARTGQPISGARTHIIVRDRAYKYSDTVYSDEAGIARFSRIPLCGEMQLVYGVQYGYQPDSIMNKSLQRLHTDLGQDHDLLLKPREDFQPQTVDELQSRIEQEGGHMGNQSVTLAWGTYDDLDLGIQEPNGNFITYNNRNSGSGGVYEIDMNYTEPVPDPLEHISWPNDNPPPGTYRVFINSFRRNTNAGNIPVKVMVNVGGQRKLVDATIPNSGNGGGRGKMVYEFRYPN